MNRDTVAIVAAITVHAVLGVALAMTPKRPPGPPKVISVDVRKNVVAPPELPPPPKLEPPKPEPPKPPKPEPQKIKRPPEPAKAPPPNETKPPPKEPPKEPPKPVFGVSMSSTTEGDSDFVVPVGNTTVADPKKGGKKGDDIPAMPAAPRAAPEFVPASPLDVSSDPEVDSDPFNDVPYPDGEAKNLGIEGATVLRIEVDESGRVHGVRVVRGVGGGDAGVALDKLAARVANKLRFKPARDKSGKPVAFVITNYRVNWEIVR